MTRYILYVPDFHNDGSAVTSGFRDSLERRLETLAGGWTATKAIGGWVNPGGERYREAVTLYHVDVDTEKTDPMIDVAATVRDLLAQECVKLDILDETGLRTIYV